MPFDGDQPFEFYQFEVTLHSELFSQSPYIPRKYLVNVYPCLYDIHYDQRLKILLETNVIYIFKLGKIDPF